MTKQSATITAAHAIGASAYGAAITRRQDGYPLYALEAVRTAQAGLDVLTREAVEEARAGGATWQAVADALGLASKQTAQQRYGD